MLAELPARNPPIRGSENNPEGQGFGSFGSGDIRAWTAARQNITLTLDWDCFWRENTHDGIYGPAVNLIQSGKTSNARYVGNQTEAMLEWRMDRHLTLTADYAHFFVGDFLKETTPGK